MADSEPIEFSSREELVEFLAERRGEDPAEVLARRESMALPDLVEQFGPESGAILPASDD